MYMYVRASLCTSITRGLLYSSDLFTHGKSDCLSRMYVKVTKCENQCFARIFYPRGVGPSGCGQL